MGQKSKIFGVDTDNRRTVSDSKRGDGYDAEQIDNRDINEVLFKTRFDHIINTEANVAANNGTIYYYSTGSVFRDKNDATVTILDGDRILWAGLDAITANIDLSSVDELEHTTDTGVTIALGSYTLSLGEKQEGSLSYTGGTSVLSGGISLNNSGGKSVDFSAKSLIINVKSNTTADADADHVNFINSDGSTQQSSPVNVTYDITSNLMSGTSEKPSHWYQLWMDFNGNMLMVPDLTGSCDGTSSGFLVDSGSTFFTDLVKAGDIIYNTTDLTQTTVATTPTTDGANLDTTDDIFASGENYKIRLMSPTGISSINARIGAVYNNSSYNLDNSTYTQIQEEKSYLGDGTDFSVSSVPAVTNLGGATARVKQVNDWTGAGAWMVGGNITYDVASVAGSTATMTLTGIIFKTGYRQQCTGITDVTSGTSIRNNAYSDPGTGDIVINHGTITKTGFQVSMGYLELDKKPTFHS